jgi:ribosomal protein S27E
VKDLRAQRGDQLRVICPKCETVWTTLALPSECPHCSALVTMRLVRPRPVRREFWLNRKPK